MYFSSDFSPWMSFVHILISLFDTTIARYLFYGLVLLVLLFITLKKRSFGEESAKMEEAERATMKLTKYTGRAILFGATGFVCFQLIRIYIID